MGRGRWKHVVDKIAHKALAGHHDTAVNRAFSVFAAVVDDDGDTDVLSASSGNNKIAWYENLSPITAVHGAYYKDIRVQGAS